ncbi:38319_t:CDS:2 [Gigaspora margarita]|uniref:38319_t:CDS:1 n=1 Tax=Gigaspora margarita TaxID=4874 RepID=A0ABN7UFZ3_GIGMA|nr:38319_t:CDS:2 [Gigaspora margarita]
MDISNDYEPVDTDMKTQNSKKVLSIEMSNKPVMDTSELEILSNPWEPTTTHTILEEPSFTNTPHGEIKIRDTNGYEELVKKYLQIGQPYKVHGNILHAIMAEKRNIELTKIRESQDGRILTVNTEIKQQPFQITNIYAPPKQEDRVRFFEKWTPMTMEEKICIIARDFNNWTLSRKEYSKTLQKVMRPKQ